MIFNVLANTGSSMAGVETLELDDAVMATAQEVGYAPHSGQSAIFEAVRLAECLEVLAANSHLQAVGGGSLENDLSYPVSQLARLLRMLTKHHAAILEVSK